MWTAGEKQFYVFSLLDALIKHLPVIGELGPYMILAAK
jgi:hypothetical protein